MMINLVQKSCKTSIGLLVLAYLLNVEIKWMTFFTINKDIFIEHFTCDLY